MIGLAMMLATQDATAVPGQKLDALDRAFVCPENLPSDEARRDAVKLFIGQLAAIEPNMTIKDVVEYRQSLLVRHRCTVTLENQRRNTANPQ